MPTRPETHKPNRIEPQRPIQRDRGTTTERGYGWAWQKLRKAVLDLNPCCVHCELMGRTTAATEVDHIVAKSKGGTDEESNLCALCISCHSIKSCREDGAGFRPKGER